MVCVGTGSDETAGSAEGSSASSKAGSDPAASRTSEGAGSGISRASPADRPPAAAFMSAVTMELDAASALLRT